MEKTKVKISKHVADIMELGSVATHLNDASYRLEELAVQTDDSLLKDIAKYLIDEIEKHQIQISGYVDDNYEFVKEEK